MSAELPKLPLGWKYLPLASLCQEGSVTYGIVQPGKETDNGVPIVRVNNFRENHLDLSEVMKVSAEIASKYERTKLHGGEVLLTVVGSVGQVAIAPKEIEGYNVARAVAVLHPNQIASAEWIALALQSPFSRHRLVSRANTTVQTTINLKDLRALPIPIPPSKVRESITDIIGKIDDRITLLRQSNDTLEKITQTLFKSWFVDFDPVKAKAEGKSPEGISSEISSLFSDALIDTEYGKIPKEWSLGNLSSFVSFQNGYAFNGSDWKPEGHPVVKIGNVKPLLIDLNGCSYVSPDCVTGLSRFMLRRGDLLVGMTGYVGETGLMPNSNIPAYINQRVGRLTTKNGLADIGFAFAAVRQPAFKTYAEKHAHGSAQPNISGSDIVKFPVIIPPKDLIDAFNKILLPIIEAILNHSEKLDTLIGMRDTLLPRLISGQLNIETSEVNV